MKIIPMIRTVQSFLHFWGLESCVRSKSYNAGSDPLWPTLSVLSHDFVNASIEDVAVTSLGKPCVCVSSQATLCIISSRRCKSKMSSKPVLIA